MAGAGSPTEGVRATRRGHRRAGLGETRASSNVPGGRRALSDPHFRAPRERRSLLRARQTEATPSRSITRSGGLGVAIRKVAGAPSATLRLQSKTSVREVAIFPLAASAANGNLPTRPQIKFGTLRAMGNFTWRLRSFGGNSVKGEPSAMGESGPAQKRPLTPKLTAIPLIMVLCIRSVNPRYHTCGALVRFEISQVRFTAGLTMVARPRLMVFKGIR